jgi:hypothetical protein
MTKAVHKGISEDYETVSRPFCFSKCGQAPIGRAEGLVRPHGFFIIPRLQKYGVVATVSF